jgi:L-aspartate oxidase
MAYDRETFDGVLIVGAGLAGLSAALAAAPRPVLVLSAVTIGEGCASAWAQGGMAAALRAGDTPQQHAADTLAAGDGLCDPAAVEILTREAPEAVRRLAALGAPFDRDEGGAFVQGLEAAHSRARVAKVGGDGAGLAIMRAVIAAVRAAAHIEGVRVRGLLQDDSGGVHGVLAEKDGAALEIVAPATLLATGGVGGLYAVTTNPASARGEGLAMAALAGARIDGAEFVQFHPTAIDIDADPAPLATEALRGDGATLIGSNGRPFMRRYDPAGDLAPRDVVARAIAAELRAGRGAFLDARAAVGEAFPEHFPAVFALCMAAGVDPRRQPIPVQPAAHYHMGGVATDAEGRTSLPGLYAAGEVASTGVHGANRLASNSLVEAAVFGRRAGKAAAAEIATPVGALEATPVVETAEQDVKRLRILMMETVGVVRDGHGLENAVATIRAMTDVSGPALPLVAAGLIAEAALARRASVGGHFRSDDRAAVRAA